MPSPSPLLRLVTATPGPAAPEGGAEAREPADATLVALVRAGERHAFEQLYRRHAPGALRLAVRLAGHGGDAEDVLHDAFLRARDGLHELRDPGAFRAWLGSIVVRLVRSRLRRARLLSGLGFAPAGATFDLDSIASRDASPEDRALVAEVYSLLAELPADLRIAWALRHVERHRLEDVAALTGCSLATAKRRIARAELLIEARFAPTTAEVGLP